MVRKLKFQEKLLKRVDFLNWEAMDHELLVLQRYHPKQRARPARAGPFLVRALAALLGKLYSMGLLPTQLSLKLCDTVTASSFCRRCLSVLLVKRRMAQHLRAAMAFVQQGHVRVGPHVVTDPACLVTRDMEDLITWVDSSKIKRHVLNYSKELDDFDLYS